MKYGNGCHPARQFSGSLLRELVEQEYGPPFLFFSQVNIVYTLTLQIPRGKAARVF